MNNVPLRRSQAFTAIERAALWDFAFTAGFTVAGKVTEQGDEVVTLRAITEADLGSGTAAFTVARNNDTVVVLDPALQPVASAPHLRDLLTQLRQRFPVQLLYAA